MPSQYSNKIPRISAQDFSPVSTAQEDPVSMAFMTMVELSVITCIRIPRPNLALHLLLAPDRRHPLRPETCDRQFAMVAPSESCRGQPCASAPVKMATQTMLAKKTFEDPCGISLTEMTT